MFLLSVSLMRECDHFLSNGLLACPKSVNGFLICLHVFSNCRLFRYRKNWKQISWATFFSKQQNLLRLTNDTRIFFISKLISCPKPLTSFHHTISRSVGKYGVTVSAWWEVVMIWSGPIYSSIWDSQLVFVTVLGLYAYVSKQKKKKVLSRV